MKNDTMSSKICLQEPQLFSQVFEIINSAILLVDAQNEVVLANSKAQAIFREKKEAIIGKPLAQFFMPEDRDVLVKNILSLTESQGSFEGEAMLLRPDGSKFIAIIATSAWPYKNRTGLVLTIHDITRLKDLERLLRSSERMAFLGRMLDDISHQIRNPVLAIGGFARRLAKMECGRPEYVNVILEEAGRLELLLKTLTDFLRLPRPRLKMLTALDLMDFLLPGIEALVQEKRARFVPRVSKEIEAEKALVDPGIFQQAVFAAVANACEAYEAQNKKPYVKVLITPCEDTHWAYEVVIQDEGMGIRPGILPLVFDPFFTTKTGHIGMGLTFAKRIQEEQQGRIAIESELGQGTIVRMPLARERRREIRTKSILL